MFSQRYSLGPDLVKWVDVIIDSVLKAQCHVCRCVCVTVDCAWSGYSDLDRVDLRQDEAVTEVPNAFADA